jgi:hypothetical protein
MKPLLVLCVQPPDEASRFQVEIQFSNGANYDPRVTKVMNDKPRENVQRNESVPLGEFTDHLNPWSSQRKANAPPASVMGQNDLSLPYLPPTRVYRTSSLTKFVSETGASQDEL